jgi:hypothetical protein
LGDFIGKIKIAARLKNLPLAFCEDGKQCRFIPIMVIDLREWPETPMQAHQGR